MAQGLQKKGGELIKKVAVTGPESTGKSELSKQLAEYYQTVWVPEYAREYIDRLNRPYEQQDVEEIAKGQLRLEDQMAREASKVLFCDTELTVISIWMMHKYNAVPDWLVDQARKRKYDLYLLCDIDLPWQYDPQREHPDLRKYFFDRYYAELKSRNANLRVVSGQGESRLENAIRFVDELLKS